MTLIFVFSSFKAQGVIDDVVNSIIDHIRPGPCRLDWDSLMTSMDILEHFEEVCLEMFQICVCVCAYVHGLETEREQACTCGHEHVYTLEFIALRISSDGKALTGEVLLPFKKLEFAHIS